MRLHDLWSSLIRRWYVALAGLALTAGLVLLALQVVHPVWESKASVVLLPPKSTVGPGENPYLQLGGLAPTLDLVVASLGDQSTLEQVQALSSAAEYTVKADTSSSGPVLIITAHDRTPAESLAIRNMLLDMAPERLKSLQESLAIPTRSQITSKILTVDGEAEIVGKNQIRAAVVAAGVGLVGTAFVVAALDGLLLRRREQRQIQDGSVDIVEVAPVLKEFGGELAPEQRRPAPVSAGAAPKVGKPFEHGWADAQVADADDYDGSDGQVVIDADAGSTDGPSWAWGDSDMDDEAAAESELQPDAR